MVTWVGANSNYNSSTNWTGDTPDAPGEAAIFGATGSTNISVNAPVNPDSWTFSNTAQAFGISGAAVTLNSGLINNSAVAEAIFSTITGAGSLQQNGSGSLGLVGDNTYTGGTTINGGILFVGAGGSTGSIVGDVVNNGIL